MNVALIHELKSALQDAKYTCNVFIHFLKVLLIPLPPGVGFLEVS
jgi:hypothetical protein